MKTSTLGLFLLLAGCSQSTNMSLSADGGPDVSEPDILSCDDLDYEWPTNHSRAEEVLYSGSVYPRVPTTFFEERMGFASRVPASELTLVGSTLVAELRWDGNCRDHYFELHFIREAMDGAEFHVYLELTDAAIECPDTCELQSEYATSFDLSAVASMGESEGVEAVWVHINEQPPLQLEI